MAARHTTISVEGSGNNELAAVLRKDDEMRRIVKICGFIQR